MNRADYARYEPTQVRFFMCPVCAGDCGRCGVCNSSGAVRVNRHDAHDFGLSRISRTAKAPLLSYDEVREVAR